MKKSYILIALMMFFVASSNAQETYENARISSTDLNGTARYVGMGGAMDALGADLSTISSNPAGIGLFRSSQAKLSFGVVSQADAESFAGEDKTKLSFDQVGFVYSTRTGRSSFLNFAFNYHKNKNFNHILSAAGNLNGASQSKLSYLKGYEGIIKPVYNNDGVVVANENQFTQLDYLYYNAFLSNTGDDKFYYNDASSYQMQRANSGYIGEYDFNISGNINDRLYLGITVGIHDVNYKGYSEYSELFLGANGANAGAGYVTVSDERKISGTGFDVKAGVIFRPIEESPFRVGLSIASPVWYDLETANYTNIYNNTDYGLYDDGNISEVYEFKMHTPWKFGLSMGTTVGNYLALGACYEFADYGNIDSRINTGSSYDYWTDSYYESSDADRNMNRHTEQSLKGVNTLKIGAEFRPDPTVAIRFGYNYVSPMYNKDAYKSVDANSPGLYYSSAADYTNWESTNRFTCGVGYTSGKLTFDIAYQYSSQSGKFSPFTPYYNDEQPELTNVAEPIKVDNKRHQLLMTLGYSF